MADDELVESIVYPAEDAPGLGPPNAIPEVFYRIVSRNGRGGATPVDEMIQELRVPLLLLWGEKDPWMVASRGPIVFVDVHYYSLHSRSGCGGCRGLNRGQGRGERGRK